MQPIRLLLAALLLAACALPAAAQTIKTLGYNTTNGRVVANTGTNALTFTNLVSVQSLTVAIGTNQYIYADDSIAEFFVPISFSTKAAPATRTNLSLGATWLTNTNVTNFRTAIGFSTNLNALWTATNAITASDALGFALDPDEGGPTINAAYGLWDSVLEERGLAIVDGDPIFGSQGSNAWRIALGLGTSNIVTFAGITNNGDIRINQTTPTNGLLYVYRTNNESFLGLANLIASNNVTVSNETLFRVGVAEATNKAAQFGFRATNTNGTGVAVFSTFGNNALMMIGASDRSQGQAAIEADIWTISPTNRVMTLRDTNTGAMTMHRDIGFAATLTNAAPTNATNVAVWLRVWVGTNNYRLPLYQ